VLKELLGLEMIGTRKQDGSSLTIIKRNDEFIVCSRRQLLDNTSVMYQYVEREKIMERMTAYGQNLAIQGEFCGPKVNGNHMCLSDYQYYVFNIKNLDTGSYLGYVDIVKMCDELKLQTVPVVFEHVCDETWTIAKFQAIANEQKYITPTGKKVPGEGIVVRSKIPVYSKVLRKNLSVKIINQNYKD
jgi:ATP-dependent RNA circularization protein (DNA/RNA ligase family)